MDPGAKTQQIAEMARLWLDSKGGSLPTSGRSMRPTFEDISKVRVEKCARGRFGDVVVFANGDFLVVHRVVIPGRGGRCRTKGDGLPHFDVGWVSAERILGCVVEIEKGQDRFRSDGRGGRLYGTLAAACSGIEGALYFFAWRLDRLLTPRRDLAAGARGRTTIRRALTRTGRATMGFLDRSLFRRMNTRIEAGAPAWTRDA